MKFRWLDQLKKTIRLRRLQVTRKSLLEMEEREIPYDRTWKMCELILEHIREQNFHLLSAQTQQSAVVRTPFKSLQTYNDALWGIFTALNNEQKIERSWSSFEALSLSLSEFMVTEDSKFYMSRDSLIVLVSRGRSICQLMSQAEGEDTGVMAHNQRVLIHFFVRYKDTLMDLFDLQFAL